MDYISLIICSVPILLIISGYLKRFIEKLRQEELQRQSAINYLKNHNSSPSLKLQLLIDESTKYQDTWGKLLSFKFNSTVTNTLSLIIFIPITFVSCFVLEFNVRAFSTFFGTNELFPKYDSESLRFFCNGARIAGIIITTIIFVPIKRKEIGFLFGLIYLISSFFLPSEIHFNEFVIVIYKGFTSYIGGIFGMIKCHTVDYYFTAVFLHCSPMK